MKVHLPRFQEAISVGIGGIVSRDWYRFFRDLWTSMGWDSTKAVYSDLAIDAGQANAAGSAVTLTTFLGSLKASGFPAATDESVHLSIRLPNNYLAGSTLSPYFEWAPSDGTAGDVDWELEYSIGGNGDTLSTSTTESTTATASGTADTLARVLLSDISGTGVAAGDLVVMRFTRKGANASDTYANDALLFVIGFKIRLQGFGTTLAHP